ncbi:hypothetical protein ABZ172_16715 [Streptomyces sp. NPDC006296]|uniref:hypothetical protein n=1 Tax=Streptomyces sp. NPDC006296 TaxID=3156746 RepID=UPI0033A9507A
MTTSSTTILKATKGPVLRDPLGRQYVTDTQTDTVAVLMGEAFGSVYVRPVHGGPERAIGPDRLRSATAAEIRAAQ